MKKLLLWFYEASKLFAVVLIIAIVYRAFVAENIDGDGIKRYLGLIAFFVIIILARHSGRLLK
jgi:hypothetical protein